MRSANEINGQIVYLEAMNESLSRDIMRYSGKTGYEITARDLSVMHATNQGKLEALRYILGD